LIAITKISNVQKSNF